MHEVSAAEEFARNPDLKPEDVTTLRTWLDTQAHLPPVTDEMLIWFHHSCFFDIEKTQQRIENYFMLRTNHPELFTKRDVSDPLVSAVYYNLKFAVLPKRDPEGHQVMFHTFKGSEPSKYIQVEAVKLMMMTVDACLLKHGTTDGIVVYIDMQGFRLSHFTKIGLATSRVMLQYIQDAIPIRLTAVHIINVVPLVDMVMALVKPFLKKELMSIIHFHTGGLDSFHKCVPKDCLPSDHGGELGTVQEMNEKYFSALQSLAGYFAEEEKCRVDEKKREKKTKSKRKDEEVSLEKLEID